MVPTEGQTEATQDVPSSAASEHMTTLWFKSREATTFQVIRDPCLTGGRLKVLTGRIPPSVNGMDSVIGNRMSST